MLSGTCPALSTQVALGWDMGLGGGDVHGSHPCLGRKLAIQEMWVKSLNWEDPLEKEMANPLEYSCLGNPMDSGA